MGRTIALKLTDKEERIVSRLNRAGVSNSELLRDALWQYFKEISEDDQSIGQKTFQNPTGTMSPMMQEYISHLKEEISQLREQNIGFQKQIGEEISRLHGQLYRISRSDESTTKLSLARKQTNDISSLDLHKDIDEFLWKKEEKKE
ncbi:MAG: hypothetical protein V1726_03915 [Methanobacteriota archaeon]